MSFQHWTLVCTKRYTDTDAVWNVELVELKPVLVSINSSFSTNAGTHGYLKLDAPERDELWLDGNSFILKLWIMVSKGCIKAHLRTKIQKQGKLIISNKDI